MRTCVLCGLDYVELPEQIGPWKYEQIECADNMYHALLNLEPDLTVVDFEQCSLAPIEICSLAGLNPICAVIVIGKDIDFSIMKDMLNSGIFAVVSTKEELAESSVHAVEARDELQIADRSIRTLQNKLSRSINLLREKFFEDLMFGSHISSLDIERQLAYYNISLDRFVIMATELDMLYHMEQTLSEEDIRALVWIVVDQIETLLEARDIQGVLCVRNQRIYTMVPVKDEEHEARILVQELAEDLSAMMKAFGKFTVSTGLSQVGEGVSQLRKARAESERGLAARFYLGDNCIVHIDDVGPVQSDVELDPDLIEDFRQAVSSGTNISEMAEKLGIAICQLGNPTRIKIQAVEVITSGVLAYEESFGSMEEVFEDGADPINRIFHAATAEAVSNELKDFAEKLQTTLERKLSSNTSRTIEQAKAYLENNYSKDVTLLHVADHVHMSQWYFSKLFRKETGTTFSDYLIQLRIRKAKELIRLYPELKNYEVAKRVGFSDARYFGQLFKKVTGITPGAFRRIPSPKPKYRINDQTAHQTPMQYSPTKPKQESKRSSPYSKENKKSKTVSAKSSPIGKNTLPLNYEESSIRGRLALLSDAVEAGRVQDARKIASQSLEEGVSYESILDTMSNAMKHVGKNFGEQKIFVPEMLLSARAMGAVITLLKPYIMKQTIPTKGRILIGTVLGDLHDVGKNLVGMMLQSAGFEIIDLGVNVSSARFIGAIQDYKPHIVGLSAMLTTTTGMIKQIISDIRRANLNESFRIMIGGAPVTQKMADEYGADGYSEHAAAAVELAYRLIDDIHCAQKQRL